MNDPLCTRHIEIRDLPLSADRHLNTLAASRGIPKHQLIREALVDYVASHPVELTTRNRGRVAK